MTSASAIKKVHVESKQFSYQAAGQAPYTDAAVYYGQYSGNCGNDGFYYNDVSSFVICSNGNAYIQPCAPGSQNSVFSSYNRGTSYYNRDFCSVNLVDAGYNAGYNAGYGSNAGYGPVPNAGYGHASIGYNAHSAGSAGAAHGGSYQNTEYGSYGTHAKTYAH
ncbi:hypothetical protein CAPTEDRAFT_201296 [Capitella teleta]|uniref:Uncharacterized protein n=1 Tax=Capitella teleta TaxID=283909 RepID=R7UT72_CAPTE|nr:hypothetical protein CAPTEDRAFT_201296 [Capitella teleta]|eukprot:ELU09405.1 hypothetical protein CAPTEDRAFT_201296 [Capitella teleta]